MNAAITFELQIDGGYHIMLDLLKMNCYIPNGKPVDSYYILFGDSYTRKSMQIQVILLKSATVAILKGI